MTAIAPISCNRCPPNITTGSRERGANLSTRYSGIFGADGSTGSSRSSSDFGIRYTPKAQHHITTRVADDLLHSILGPGKGHKAYRGNGRKASNSQNHRAELPVSLSFITCAGAIRTYLMTYTPRRLCKWPSHISHLVRQTFELGLALKRTIS